MSGNKRPLVSILMNCYNSDKYLKQAINSVYAQTYDSWEIIFWDNASTDESAFIASQYDEKLRYFKSEVNTTLHAARNMAIQQARGEFIAFLDCDDLWMPTKLECQIPLFDDPDVGLVFGDSMVFNDQGDIFRNFKKRRAYSGLAFEHLLKDYTLHLVTVVVRKSVVDAHRIKFNEQLYIAGDAEYFLSIAYYSKINYTRQVIAKYRLHGESLSQQKKLETLQEIDAIYEKLAVDLPLLLTKYKRSLLVAKSNLVISKAIYYWRLSNKKMMRQWLLSSPIRRPKIWILFMCSFFSYGLIAKIANK